MKTNSDGDFKNPSKYLITKERTTFTLKVDNLTIGTLHCEDGMWEFKYSDEFKKQSHIYNPITGFPDLNKVYKSESLWPFFFDPYTWSETACSY